MPRPLWKGQLSFGLVNIPVMLYPAEQARELHFNMLDSRDNARIKFQRVNESTGEEVPWDKIVKGYEHSDGNYVILTDQDFKKAAVEATKTVEIEDFVDAAAVEWMFIDKPYYLAPDKRGDKGYVLLRETLKRVERVAIARVVIRAREHIAAVTVRENALVLILLRYQDEIRDAGELNLPGEELQTYKISEKELKIAGELVEAMYTDWKPEKYHDQYRDSLMKWIDAKARTDGAEPVAEEQDEEPEPQVVNIMKLLEQSVQRRGGKASPRKAATSVASRDPKRAARPRRKGA